MPKIDVVIFKESSGEVPLLQWLRGFNSKAQIKCLARVQRLRDNGHDLRRPEADYLRDDIYELRVGRQGINYRILYFFYGNKAAILSHGIVKERVVPVKEIEMAIKRKRLFEQNPVLHTYLISGDDDEK